MSEDSITSEEYLFDDDDELDEDDFDSSLLEEEDDEEDDDEEGSVNLEQNEQGGHVPRPVQNREVGRAQLGFQDQNVARVDDNLQPNYEDFGSSLSNPSSPLNSPGSRSSTNAREDRERASDLLMSVSVSADTYQNKISRLAFKAMDELVKMAFTGEPLWQPRSFDRPNEVLNGLEYLRTFGGIDATCEQIIKLVEVGDPNACDLNLDAPYTSEPKPNPSRFDPLRIEASRDCALVPMNANSIVDLFMDLKQWSTTFMSIVSRATVLGVLSTGTSYRNYDGMIQVISAEFNLPTTFVPPRVCQFARYCRQLDSGTWAVVDISLETLFPYPVIVFRRRPSGCVIQELPQAQCSKVTWVEHVEADNSLVHRLFEALVNSGFAFCATRWLSCITRYSEDLLILLSRNNPVTFGVFIAPTGRTSMLKAADKMMKFFFHDINASSENSWLTLPVCGGQDIKYMTRVFAVGPARSMTSTITFTTSAYIPCPPKRTFDFLRDENCRCKWDMLLNGHEVKEIAYVVGTNPLNRVSVLRAHNYSKNISVLLLQKTYKNETGSYVIHAPVDNISMALMLNGGNPDFVAVLPSGFVILPDRLSLQNENVGGTILTLAFHIIDTSSVFGLITAEKANIVMGMVNKTIHLIKHSLIASNNHHHPPIPRNWFPGESSSNPKPPFNLWQPRK